MVMNNFCRCILSFIGVYYITSDRKQEESDEQLLLTNADLFPGMLIIINPLTPCSDQHETSPYNTFTLSSKQVMRIFKLTGSSCYLDLTPNSHS